MKRKIITITIVVSAVVSFAVFNVSNNPDNIKFTDISLDNVEALAQESGEPECVHIKGICCKMIFTPESLSFQ